MVCSLRPRTFACQDILNIGNYKLASNFFTPNACFVAQGFAARSDRGGRPCADVCLASGCGDGEEISLLDTAGISEFCGDRVFGDTADPVVPHERDVAAAQPADRGVCIYRSGAGDFIVLDGGSGRLRTLSATGGAPASRRF